MSSSGSESDEEYVPGEPEKVSEEESADEETDLLFEQELDQKAKKRKAIETKVTKKRKTRQEPKVDTPVKETEESDEVLNPEEEKKKEDDLWAKFLEGTDTKPKPTSTVTSTSIQTTKPVTNKTEPVKTDVTKSNDNQAREQKIFQFAGETIVVENNKIKEKIKTADSPATVSNLDGPSRGRPGAAGGLSSVLGQLNKKNKLSTLEKSKLDWSTYKQDEGIEEEIQSHNKGRNGYLDKRDFLERADVRQYEIERDLRMGRRSNR